MNKPELENVEIERAHRVKSSEKDKSVIMVKFSRYKDREQIFNAAKTALRHSEYSVKEDFTQRVKHCRRELGKHLLDARDKGLYAAMHYDKLIIENEVYKYDGGNQDKKKVGQRSRGTNAARASRRRENLDISSGIIETTTEGGASGLY